VSKKEGLRQTMLRQRTINTTVSAVGIGVHSGTKVQLTLKPAPQNTGVTFVRTDLPNYPSVHASVRHVSSTVLTTSLTDNGVTVSCVEHLMSAIWSLGIDNLMIEITNEEIPIMDGSAAPFIYLIKSAGVREQTAAKQFIKIKSPIEVTMDDGRASFLPYNGFKASYTFVYDHHVFNRYPKYAELDFSEISFVDDVSRARSFGLIKDLDQAQAVNKCLGSSLENAIGIDDYTILNKDGLRYQDEFVKHKLLDAIGDLYLLGKPVIGEFVGFKSGHSLNNVLGRTLLRHPEAWELISFEDEDEAETMKVRPFLQPIAA
jgi:UDP-3-O-[3-hydroxymyristoyl] N-acetylglucosamine deacetylase